ncbi:MAG: hypothetical protein HEQ23_10635 [Tepidisphaera sp.]
MGFRSRPGHAARLLIPLTTALCGLGGGSLADIPRFDQVPEVFTQSPSVFRKLFRDATTTGTHAVMIGDSQETCPGGFGQEYVPRFNWELWNRYGNAPSTPWASMRTSYGDQRQWGQWLLRAGSAPPNMTESRVNPERLPPSFQGGKTSTRGGVNINNNQQFGQLLMLQHNCASVSPGTGIDRNLTYFPAGSTCDLEVIGATHPSSGEVFVRITSTATQIPNYYEPIQRFLTSSMGLESPEEDFKSQRLGPFVAPAGRFVQAEIAGTDPTKFTDVIAARFINRDYTWGWTVTSVSEGGYTSATLLNQHQDSFRLISEMQPDVVFICYGANDVTAGFSPDDYRSNVKRLIARIRAACSKPIPVILMSDPARGGRLTDAEREVMDRYAGANYVIALEDPLVCALNSRLLTQNEGWKYENLHLFTDYSMVHYSPNGARTKARVEVAALLREFTGCFADFNADDMIDLFDYIDFYACFERRDCPPDTTADVNFDGFVDVFDLIAFLEAFESNCR